MDQNGFDNERDRSGSFLSAGQTDGDDEVSQIFQPNSEENSGLIGTVLNGINSQKRNSLRGKNKHFYALHWLG